MKNLLVVLGMSLALPMVASAESHITERRCGWLENPTPANYTLVDEDGTWTLAVQGGYQADGLDNLPAVNPREFERTNGNYGRSCACLDVEVDYAPRLVNYIAGGESRPLAECRAKNFPDDNGGVEPAPAPEPTPVPQPRPLPKPPKQDPWVDPSEPSDSPYTPKEPKLPKKDWDDSRKQRDQKDWDDRGQRDQKDDKWNDDWSDDQDHWYPRGDRDQRRPRAPRDANAEIQIFMDYRGYNDYSVKYVSTFDQVISAGLLYPSEFARNGACFAGSPEAAVELFEAMVDEMNYTSHRDVRVHGTVFFDGGDTGKPALQIYATDEMGQGFVWFDRIRKCDRWSTPEERANRP